MSGGLATLISHVQHSLVLIIHSSPWPVHSVIPEISVVYAMPVHLFWLVAQLLDFFFFFAYVMLTFRVSLTKIYYRTGVWPVLRYERYSLKPWSCNVQFLARLSHLLVLFVSISIAISTKFNSGVKVNSDNREV